MTAPPDTPASIDPAEVNDLLMALAEFGRHADTGVWRTVYSPEWLAAMDCCKAWGRDHGLTMRRDAVGNLWAALPGRSPGPSIVTGSHIDSQRPGGRYDGALGAIAGLVALSALRAQCGQPERTLECVVFCEEEGSRFPTAGFWGSRAITGRTVASDMETVLSHDGEPIGAVMRQVGLDPDRVAEAKRDDIAAFVEVHIEQGPILEDAGLPVAVVDAITGIAQFEVVLEGEQNHAGAFPMDIRRDPMAGFAEIASTLIDHAHRLGRPAVTTIGRCEVYPAGSAIIPRRVTFSIDARHPDPEKRRAMYATHARVLEEVCTRRGLTYSYRPLIDLEPCLSDPALVATLKAAAEAVGVETLTMASGAGHDTQQMALIAPTAMLFVRSAGGRSHTPEEFSTLEDCVDGIKVLTEALRRMAY